MRSIAVTCVTLAFAYGVWYSYAVFLVALLADFGWSRSLVAGAFSLFAFVHGLLSPPLGWLGDRLGPRRLILAGGSILVVALLLDSMVDRPWHLYLAFGLATSVGVAAAGWVPAVVLVQRWFPRRIGLALGVASAGIGVGIFVVVPGCQWLIEAHGWRWAFRVLAGLVAAWVIPATLWLLRDPPLARPLAPPGGSRGDIDVATSPEPTLALATRTVRFWLLLSTQFLGNAACQMLLVHQVAYLVDHGLPALLGASVVSVVGLTSVGGKIGGGWLSDRVGREATYTAGMACVIGAIGTLGLIALRPGVVATYAYGVLIGAGYSVTAALMPAVASDLYRGRHFGAIFGTMHVANALGGSAGPLVAGWVFDTTGGYAPTLVGAALAASVATLGLWLAGPRRAWNDRES